MSGSNELAQLARSLSHPEKIRLTIGRMLVLPQAVCNVRHIFGPRLYMRELTAKAGTLLIGKCHKLDHDCILVRGALQFVNKDESLTQLEAPLEFKAGPGRKVALVESDLTFVNVHHLEGDLQDVEQLEAMLYEPEQLHPDPLPPLEPDGDFEAMLLELGINAEKVREVSHRQDDVGLLPYGAYKVKRGPSRIEGHGLIATCDIEAGERIAPGTWAGKRTIAGRYTNHARWPNAHITYDAEGIAWLHAIAPIAGSRGGADGEEVTIDYRLTRPERLKGLT